MEAYAWSLVGSLYIWGGEGPEGFDCSGLVQEILRSVGEDPPGDQTAQNYYDHFRSHSRRSKPELGALAFYGKSPNRVSHVAFCISDLCCIEAGGGDSSTTSRDRAVEQNAFVRVRPIAGRKDLLAILRPKYKFEV